MGGNTSEPSGLNSLTFLCSPLMLNGSAHLKMSKSRALELVIYLAFGLYSGEWNRERREGSLEVYVTEVHDTCPALLNHGSPSVCLHPALFQPSPPLSSVCLSVSPAALQALLTKTLLITYQNYPKSLLTCPASPSQTPRSCLRLHFIAFGNSLLFPTSCSLTHSSLQSLSASHPPLCLSASFLLVSKSLRGISDSLADLPLLHLKSGWLNFSFTFLQLSSSQSYLKCKL